ncbi:MAG: VOC family protein [Chthoniobacterales bacterium]
MIQGINHITLAVQDIGKSFSFYREVLGFIPLVKWDSGAYFLIGKKDPLLPGSGFWFCLNVDTKHQPHDCYTHGAFSVSEKDFEVMVARIADSGAICFQENSSPGKSFYFLDPDGHKLEIHVGTLEDRVVAKKEELGSWKNVEWFV